MPLSEKLYTAPYAEPIHLDEMKLHLRVDITTDDALITSLIRSAREYVELYTQRQLVAATWVRYLHRFPDSYCARDDVEDVFSIRLLHPPVQSVTSITYVDTNGATQTLATSVYDLDKNAEPALIRLKYVQVWPPTREQPNAVAITYIAGHAAQFTRSQNTANVMNGAYLSVADRVRVSNSGGALPSGLVANTDYLIATATTSDTTRIVTFTDTDVQAITLTSAGTGTHFIGDIPEPIRQAMKLLCSHWYEHREAASDGTVSKEIDLAVQALLYPYRVMEMA